MGSRSRVSGGRTVAAALLLLVGTGASASAGRSFTATLTHDQETVTGTFLTSTGDPRPASFGTATFDLNDAQTALSFTATIFNIDVTGTQTADPNDDLVAAHIHAPAPPGTSAGVRWGFFGTPDNDNNPDDLVVTPFASGVGGTFSSTWDQNEGNAGTTLTAELPNLLSGQAYINFHTRQFPAGEIRGQIIPLPAGVWGGMAMVGAIMAHGARRRRRRAAA